MNSSIKDKFKVFLNNIPNSPGIYQMLNASGKVMYVGKAKNLKKRVTSYNHIEKLPLRIQRMVTQIDKIQTITTNTESEALLLEANIIKDLKPRYNILLKDDKSFPYIKITDDHDFPRIMKHRGKRCKSHTYFGPFASAGDVNEAIAALQKAFLLRVCSDSILSNSKRPCMEYQIKRCSAPCVEKISTTQYAELVKETKDFLHGKTSKVQKELSEYMKFAAANMNYEKAATLRDRISALCAIQEEQSVNSTTITNADIVAIAQKTIENKLKTCVQVFFIRAGHMLGNKSYFPYNTQEHSINEVLEYFLARFYQSSQPPQQIILSHDIYSKTVLEEALSQLSDFKVKIIIPQKGEKRKMVDTAIINANKGLLDENKF